ncbi:probable WRKY transcription factor 41 [Phtheirospermum japonicum]|uniref:Probable WRKY transcription factor 41 n=1 Tax=Phtheirospermum japonicum TaxID=374723 RepID=A0A830BXA0_9LAMI|nr:probable WRKY transcription factor 41 [Phtheirospermum japonicum]
MEGALTWEYKKLVDELTQGMDKAMQLRVHLYSTSPSEAHDLLLQRIISTFQNALLILNWGGSQAGAPTPAAPESPISPNASPKSDDMNKNSRDRRYNGDTSKKRKLQPTWTEQVSCENGLEGPRDDGYSWRKYGQKDILGAKHPRSYYRCTHRAARDCWATKQVQRSDDDPTVFETTYKGIHTCNQSSNVISPQKQEPGDNEQQNQTVLDFKAKNLRTDNEDSNIMDMPSHFSFPTTFLCTNGENENHISTFSPFLYNPDASIDPVDLDPDFPFDIPGFFR